jgi:hypothetical protein
VCPPTTKKFTPEIDAELSEEMVGALLELQLQSIRDSVSSLRSVSGCRKSTPVPAAVVPTSGKPPDLGHPTFVIVPKAPRSDQLIGLASTEQSLVPCY